MNLRHCDIIPAAAVATDGKAGAAIGAAIKTCRRDGDTRLFRLKQSFPRQHEPVTAVRSAILGRTPKSIADEYFATRQNDQSKDYQPPISVTLGATIP